LQNGSRLALHIKRMLDQAEKENFLKRQETAPSFSTKAPGRHPHDVCDAARTMLSQAARTPAERRE